MSGTSSDQDHRIEWIRDLFSADLTRVVLSVVILVSVLPFSWIETGAVLFFAFFAVELALRLTVIVHDSRRHGVSRVELLLLLFDLVATLSFLPLQVVWDNARLLRLVRLSRMLLLLGYWGPVVREVWHIMGKRERRYQLAFVLVTVIILSFTSALILDHFRAHGMDFDADGDHSKETFWSMLWWAFCQLESPDNILKNPNVSLVFFFSVFLTTAGLFLFSFLVGIGSSVVDELVELSKQRPIGMRRHSVICNISPKSQVLLQELVAYYAKSFRPPRIITMGSEPRRCDFMHESSLLRIRYRQGQPLSRHDLVRVDADRATRIILLGQADRDISDSEVVSQILSVREINPTAPIYAELYHADSIAAARRAGVHRTVPIMANRLTSLYLASIIVFPGVEELFRDLLSSSGSEIYTCLYEEGALVGKRPPSGQLMPFGEMLERAHRAHGVILLGHILAGEDDTEERIHAFLPGAPSSTTEPMHPEIPDVGRLRGFFGVAPSFDSMRSFALSLPDVSSPLPPRSEAQVPRFGLCPGSTQIDRLLICGFHEGLVDFCEELILFSHVAHLFLMIPEGHSIDQVVSAFVFRAVDSGPGATPPAVVFTSGGPGEVVYSLRGDPAPTGRMRIFSSDWSDDRNLLQEGDATRESAYRLADMDAVLLTYLPGEKDPDARTSLALLKLIRLKESGSDLVKPGLRIFCEVQDTEKAALFQRRFGGRQSGSAPCSTISIVASEQMRNSFLAQGVFVPGSASIYGELLSQAGVFLCKLLPSAPAAPGTVLDFGALLVTLYQRDGLLLVAVELRDSEGHRRLVVNPSPRSKDYTFGGSELAGIFAVGEFSSVGRSPPCPDCVASRQSAAGQN